MANNQTLLTNASKFSAVKNMYYSPVALVQNALYSQMFCFLSHVDPWPDANNPPVPLQDQRSLKQIMKGIFVAKPIGTNQMSPVIRRINWTSGSIYDYYQDNVDMFETNMVNDMMTGTYTYTFYINNKYDQVFKCLWNNNGGASIVEPYFEPGSYNTNNIFKGSDGYKWKYIYTIDYASKVEFMDTNWIPVPIKEYSSNPLKNPSVGYGNIDVINVTNGGSGYSNSAITVTISGDNTTQATGYATTDNGTISDIIVTNSGANYITANVTISSSSGYGATAIAPVSPIGGHGQDALSELGCCNIMITTTFSGIEQDTSGTQMIPTDITYYQLGILSNPTSVSTSPDIANPIIYKTTTDLIVAGGFGVFVSDEIIYQGSSLAAATFTGTVLSFDPASNILKVLNTSGILNINAPVFGNFSNTVRTLLAYNFPDLVTLSGDIVYIDNRTGIQRSYDGIEQFKIVLGY